MTPWDVGVEWHLEQTADDGPDWSTDPLTEAFVLEDVLRSAHPEAERDYITHLLRVSLREAERLTLRSLLPQTWSLVLSGFPASGYILLPRPPLLSVTSVVYLDENGDPQTWVASPPDFTTVVPSGPRAGKGRICPLPDTTWPTTSIAPDAVTVTYVAGYPVDASGIAQVPPDLTQARLVAIAEMHKVRSESVHISQSTALRTARTLYRGYAVREY